MFDVRRWSINKSVDLGSEIMLLKPSRIIVINIEWKAGLLSAHVMLTFRNGFFESERLVHNDAGGL